MFETQISDKEFENKYLQKLIAVVNFGMLEKGINKHQRSFLFETREEAQYYQAQYDGQISIIRKYEETEIQKEDPLDAGCENPDMICWKECNEVDRLYILNISVQKDLTNGFRYIKELLLNFHNFKMYSDYQKLINASIDVFSVKTDSFTIKETDVDKAKSVLEFYDDIGGWRVSKTENINIPSTNYELRINNLIKIEEPKFTRLHIDDEYDTPAICKQIIKNNRVMIRAEYGGSGKSYICEYFEKIGYNVLFVVPTNVLVQKYNEAATINEFFGFGIDENVKINKFDDSSYDVIVFDEILFSDVSNLRRIKNYVDNNQNKIIVATGDVDQLKPISSYSNTKEFKSYANECINLIFPNEIYLYMNKRLKTTQDRDKLKQMKADIFNEDIPVDYIINKYSKFTQDIKQSNKNIAYRNETCKNVSNAIRHKLNKKHDYELGEVLICRKYTKIGKHVLHVNFEYTIIGISDKMIKLSDDAAVRRNERNRQCGRDVDELPEEFDVAKYIIKDSFIFNYCRTAHSIQGSSIDDSITIFDYKYEHVSREWLYVAITRATDLNNAYSYEYTENNALYNTIRKS